MKNKSKTKKPLIGITLGDPSGIGPEIIEKALKNPAVKKIANFLVIGNSFGFKPGQPSAASGRAAMKFLEKAVALAQAKKIDALVTGPISKLAINQAGYKFPGHTEFLAQKTGAKKYAMLFYSSQLKVILVTIHIPLKEVSKNISPEKIFDAIKLGHDFLKKLGIKNPKIGVAGLNPHAGESGILGDEEKKIIGPAVGRARKAGIIAAGPLAPDVIFKKALEKKFDLVVAMYHDQGLIPLKMLAFDEAVNITVGLPIIRTSPDHGTAFDIAGKGLASPHSLLASIKIAARLARSRL